MMIIKEPEKKEEIIQETKEPEKNEDKKEEIKEQKQGENLIKKDEVLLKSEKSIVQEKVEETDRKIENIIQNIAENRNKLNEQNYEINNVDTKFKLLTTFIDNQNEENFNNQNSYFHIGNINHKYNKLKRVH